MKIYPKFAEGLPESDLEEQLIAEMPKWQVAEFLKDKNPEQFFLVGHEKKHVPVAVIIPSRYAIAVYTGNVETCPPVAIFRNRPGNWKMQRVLDWYASRHYQTVVH